MTFTHSVASNNFGVAKWIVSASIAEGTHTTIASAITSASAGDTIFIRPGTYTENLTLKTGVNITAFTGDGLEGNVIILGKATYTGAGTVNISNVQLKTNSDFCLAVTGSSASIVNLQGVYINCSNNTGISFTSSSSSSVIALYECNGDLGTTGIGLFAHSGAGNLKTFFSVFTNTGASTTTTTVSGTGQHNDHGSLFSFPFAFSSSSSGTLLSTQYYTADTNTTIITTSNTANYIFLYCELSSGSASTISIGSGSTAQVFSCQFNSSNTNVITGAGTLQYAGLTFVSGTSVKINTTTQTGGLLVGGVAQAPSTGFIGEQLRSSATGTSISNSTATSVVNISVTAGVWDISILLQANGSGSNLNAVVGAISVNNNSFTGVVAGDSKATYQETTSPSANAFISIPAFRVTLTTTTTYYLVAQVNFGSGTATVDGRISATRVG